MPVPLGADLAVSAIPSIGSLGAAALQRRWAIKDWNRVNQYNSPVQQVRRLKEAGLPLASMFSGSGGSTSSDVGNTQIDPTLGTAKGLETYFTNQMQKKQLELIDKQIYSEEGKGQLTWKEAGIKANELALSNDRMQYELNAEGKDTVAPAFSPPTNQVQQLVRQRLMNQAEQFLKNKNNEMLKLEIQLKRDQGKLITEEIRNRVWNLILQSNLFAQEINRNSVIDALIGSMKKDGMSMGEAFMHVLLTGGFKTRM